MEQIQSYLKFQIGRRAKDGFSVGYNIIFPFILVGLLGVLTRNNFGHQITSQQITSYQYYTVVLITFCASMSIITAAYAAKEEAYEKTAIRIIMAPISEKGIVFVKIVSCSIVFSICNCFTFILCGLIWKIPLGIEWLAILLLLIGMSYVVAGIGILVGTGMKNFLLVKNVINIPITLFAVAGGAFYPFGSLHPVVNGLINLSPLTWVNRSIFAVLYDGQFGLILRVIAIHFIVGTVCFLVANRVFKKEEYMNGDLPSYKE